MEAKQEVRERIWQTLKDEGAARFPGARGRIPNFRGAEGAADRLAELPEWQAADVVKSNPDSPQLPVRVRALEDGKLLYMAVPRLAHVEPFFVLDPARLADTPRKAVAIKNASRSAQRVDLQHMRPVDLVVAGCVAVGEDGARLGKGGGFSDLEFALAAAAGLVATRTRVVTTVHDVQVMPAGAVPIVTHDVHVDVVVTPTRVIECPRPRGKRLPKLRWSELTDEKIAAIPLLQELRDRSA